MVFTERNAPWTVGGERPNRDLNRGAAFRPHHIRTFLALWITETSHGLRHAEAA